jgi:hypothetical protein
MGVRALLLPGGLPFLAMLGLIEPACGGGSARAVSEAGTGASTVDGSADCQGPPPDAAVDQTAQADSASDTGAFCAECTMDASTEVLEGGTDGSTIACGPNGLECPSGDVCLDVFGGGGNTELASDGAVIPSGVSNTYSCVTNPCEEDASSSCYCQICQGTGWICYQVAAPNVLCNYAPVCASWDTPIATADGARPIESLLPGDLVYSADRGALRLVPVQRVSSTAVSHHSVVELTLMSHAVLKMSAGHSTADGRLFGDLHAGDILDGQLILARRDVPYTAPYTYDIYPMSETHTYVAAGVLVGTTLRAEKSPTACMASTGR